MDALTVKLSPITAECLFREMQDTDCCLIDIRPSSQYCSSHIQASENVNFTGILLRRLIKGVVKLDTYIPSPELVQKLTERNPCCTKLVLYDGCSKEGGVKSELARHAEVLYRTNCSQSSSTQVYYLDGGFSTFSEVYPDLCKSSTARSSKSPISVSVSASLPINFGRHGPKQPMKAQTPLEDEASQFGPPVEILDHLVLGCARDSSNLALLRKMGVTAVLNVSHNCASHFEELFEYKIIPVQDSHQADLLSKLDSAFEFINSVKAKGGKVFVHCHAGISRSATVCIAYTMKHMELCLTRAYDFVKQKRPCISPNLHFMGQLLEFERQLQEATPDKSSPLFSEPSSLPMEVESIPVSISTTLPKIRNKDTLGLRLPLNLPPHPLNRERKYCLKRTIHSASAPSSIDIPEVPEREDTPTQHCMPKRNPIDLPAYNYTLMGQFYSSTDGMLYPVAVNTMTMPTRSLPTTPVSERVEPQLPTTCRTQLNLESNVGNSKSLDTFQHSPCRVVACHGGQYM